MIHFRNSRHHSVEKDASSVAQKHILYHEDPVENQQVSPLRNFVLLEIWYSNIFSRNENLKIHPSRRPSFRRSKCKTFHHLKNFAIINCISLRMQILTSSTLTFKKQTVYSEESGQKGFNILKRFQINSRVLG